MADETAGASDEGARPTGLSSPRVRLGLLIAGILVLLAGSYWYYNHQTYGRFQQSTDNAYIAADSVIISPKIAGYVERVLVTENQTVASGDALVQLDVRDYRAQTNQVEAQIAASLAGADTVRAQQQEQDAAIAQARAQLAAASAQAGLAAEQVVRYRPLAASGAEPRERLDQLEAQAREAQAQVAAARAALTAAQRRQNTLSEQIDQANSQANAARAQLEAARLNLSSTTLQASISGRVGDLTVRPGQFVQPGNPHPHPGDSKRGRDCLRGGARAGAEGVGQRHTGRVALHPVLDVLLRGGAAAGAGAPRPQPAARRLPLRSVHGRRRAPGGPGRSRAGRSHHRVTRAGGSVPA